jgi:hypothetical protein
LRIEQPSSTIDVAKAAREVDRAAEMFQQLQHGTKLLRWRPDKSFPAGARPQDKKEALRFAVCMR